VSGSPALIADAVHSLSDLLSDGVTLYTMDLSRRPHDDTQPYGYGRIEVPPRALVPLHIEH
jgi:divalent metal cation (Fe/Co/Zn/Cd) transporter